MNEKRYRLLRLEERIQHGSFDASRGNGRINHDQPFFATWRPRPCALFVLWGGNCVIPRDNLTLIKKSPQLGA